ncbi:helix-turn-helix domain-containing protein [Aeromicrobium sp. UC242_57]|uniref:helix-turn-helix domain-containing protein n=1 Tax=Aeromicrobium sp. UC242_57 TaxID=3374624 RepID=UPI0037966471
MTDAAFSLFASQGYDETSVDDIVAEAGAGRTSFFRQFGSKESVIFPDHDALLVLVEQRLRSTTEKSALRAVADAVRLVLFHYVAEGDKARQRYALTSTVETLKDRELVSGARYQRLFRRYLSTWGEGSEESELRAEMMAAAVVAAHNRVLRRWLRSECDDPQAEVDAALESVITTFSAPADVAPAILIVSSGASMEDVAASVRRVVGNEGLS